MAGENNRTTAPAEPGADGDDDLDEEPSTLILAASPPPKWVDDDEQAPGEDRTEMQMDAELVARARHSLMFGRAKPAESTPSSPANAAPPVVIAKPATPGLIAPIAPKRPSISPAALAGSAPARPVPAPARPAPKIGMPRPSESAFVPVSKRTATPPPRAPEHAAVPRTAAPPPLAQRVSVGPPPMRAQPVAAPPPSPAQNAEPPIRNASLEGDASHRRPVRDPISALAPTSDEAIEVPVESGVQTAPSSATHTGSTAPETREQLVSAVAPIARPNLAPGPSADGTAGRTAMRRRVKRSPVEWMAIVVASATVLWAIWLLLFYRR